MIVVSLSDSKDLLSKKVLIGYSLYYMQRAFKLTDIQMHYSVKWGVYHITDIQMHYSVKWGVYHITDIQMHYSVKWGV